MSTRRVTTAQARALVEGDPPAAYLDVRSVPEFEAGHVPGAYNIPLFHATPTGMVPNHGFVDEVRAALDPSAPLVVGCRAGRRSAQAAAILEQMGFVDLSDVIGGWAGADGDVGWVAGGGAVTTQPRPGRAYADLKRG